MHPKRLITYKSAIKAYQFKSFLAMACMRPPHMVLLVVFELGIEWVKAGLGIYAVFQH